MIGPIECLEKERERIQVEIHFTKGTGMNIKYEELAEKYKAAIEILESYIE